MNFSQLIMRLRAGGLYELARPEAVIQETRFDDSSSLVKGVYHIKISVFGQLEKQGFGFVNSEGTLIVPYHLTEGKPVLIDGQIYDSVQNNMEADVSLYGGHHFTCRSPVVGATYVVKNPVLCSSISLECTAKSGTNVLSFRRKDNETEAPLEGWSGLPIVDQAGNVYGIYSFHLNTSEGWLTRCYEGIVERGMTDWSSTVENALRRGVVEVVAGTGSGKTVGISRAIIDKGIKNVVVLQPTRAMVENLYTVLKQFGYNDIGYKHGEGSVNPASSFVIMTYGMFLERWVTRVVKPKLVFCDEVHQLQADVQATLLVLAKATSINRIMATATPDGVVRSHGGVHSILEDVIHLNYPGGAPLCDNLVVDPNQICKMASEGLLIFVPTKAKVTEIKTVLEAAPFSLKGSVIGVTSETIKTVSSSGILTGGGRKVLVSTNVLEAGVTVNVKHVLDFGKTCYPVFENDELVWRTVESTEMEMAQRKGRVGRLYPGTYTRVEKNFSPYDKYARTFAQLILFLRRSNIPIPQEVLDKLDSQPNLSRIVLDSDIRHINNALRCRIDPIFALQNMDSRGCIWSKVAKQFRISGMMTSAMPDTSDWVDDPALQLKVPRFKTEAKYFDINGNVHDCRYTSMYYGISLGLLAVSYVAHKFIKRTYAKAEGYLVCDWYEYMTMPCLEIKIGMIGGKTSHYIKFTELYSKHWSTLSTLGINAVLYDKSVSVNKLSKAVGLGGSIVKSCTYLPVVNIKEDELLIPAIKWFGGFVGAKGSFLKSLVRVDRWVYESTCLVLKKVEKDSVADAFSSLLDLARDFKKTVTVFRGLVVSSNLHVKTAFLSFVRGGVFTSCGIELDWTSYFISSFIRSMTVDSDKKFLGVLCNSICEFLGSVFISNINWLAEIGSTGDEISLLDLNIVMLAILSGSAIAGVKAVGDSGIFKMTPLASTSSNTPAVLGNCFIGYLTGMALGTVCEVFNHRREVRMHQIAGSKNAAILVDWLEASGRFVFSSSIAGLKLACVGACFLVRPYLSAVFLGSGLVFKGFNWECLDFLVDFVPTVLMVGENLRMGAYYSLVWTLSGPILSLCFSPSSLSYVASVTNAIAGITMTSGETMTYPMVEKTANSSSFSVAKAIDKKFELSGSVLIIGEGAGGLSQYYVNKQNVDRLVSVCTQEFTIPSITQMQVSSTKFNLIEGDIRQVEINDKYDCVFVDLSECKKDEDLMNRVKDVVKITGCKRVVSTGFASLDGYGLSHTFSINGLYYHCYVKDHVVKKVPVEELKKDDVEVYVPTHVPKVFPNVPSLTPHVIRGISVAHFEGPKLYSIGKVGINRGFDSINRLMCNSTAIRSPILPLVRFVSAMTQSSRLEADFMMAIHKRVATEPLPVRSVLLNMLPEALNLVLTKSVKYSSYSFQEAKFNSIRTGAGGLTDSYQNMGEFIDAGEPKDLRFDRSKLVWSMVPKYENRKKTGGEFPVPRVVTMSNLDFRFYSNQVLGKMNKQTPVFESTGKMLFSEYMTVLNGHKERLETENNERYMYYSGDVAYWDSRPTVHMIKMLGNAISSIHCDSERVKEIFDLQSERYCVTANGLVLYKVGGVDSGSVTTKLGNDALNAARDLLVVSVCVGLPMEEVRKKIRRLVCGDDFVGVMPMSWMDRVAKHYARVTRELGFPLKTQFEYNADCTKIAFCSHYWIRAKTGAKTVILPYRSRREILERVILQATHSVIDDKDRFAQKCLAYLMLYYGDVRIRTVLEDSINSIGPFTVLVDDSVKYGLGYSGVFTSNNWKSIIKNFYKDRIGIDCVNLRYLVEDSSIVNSIPRGRESKIVYSLIDYLE